MARARTVKLRLTLIALGLMCGVVLGEAALRVFDFKFRPHLRNRIYFAQYEALLGWANRPGISGPYGGTDFETTVTINRSGRRDSVHHAGQNSTRPRVMLLGDSQSWGDGVNNNEMFAELLEQSGEREIINTACPGYSTAQELLLLTRDGARYRPDLVVTVVYVGNDFSDNVDRGSLQYERPYFTWQRERGLELHNVPVPYHPMMQAGVTLYREAALHSAVLSLASTACASNPSVGPDPHRAIVPQTLYLPQLSPSDAEQIRLTTALLQAIRDEASALGARSVIVLIPENWQVEILAHSSIRAAVEQQGLQWRRPQTAIKHAFAGEGVLDALPALARAHHETRTVFFQHTPHLTADGHRALAEFMEQRLPKDVRDRLSPPAARAAAKELDKDIVAAVKVSATLRQRSADVPSADR